MMETRHAEDDVDEQHLQENDEVDDAAGSKDSTAPKKPNARKRTKTGCLTCRRRRIKCDEGKPICNNCIKSKRTCEGYNQRVVFKEPMSAFHPFGISMYNAPPPPQALISPPFQSQASRTSPNQGALPPIAPRPGPSGFAGPPQTLAYDPSIHGHHHAPVGPAFEGGTDPFVPPIVAPTASYMTPESIPGSANQIYGDGRLTFMPVNFDGTDGFTSPVTESTRRFQSIPAATGSILPEEGAPQHGQQPHVHSGEETYWYSDDDASMPDSEDETSPETHHQHLVANDLGHLVTSRMGGGFDAYGTQLRTFRPGPIENVLTTYIPSSTSSPLNDPQTAAIFWYFVNATGPSMSLYERHPFDPLPMFQGQPVPKARQHIWTYTYPIIALNHPALLQAMLALGSVHLANIEGSPPTAAMKHYHFCVRRLAKNYQSAARRAQPATFAATLLVSFYEVWNAEHDKWCKHMNGAQAIIKELNLLERTRAVMALKRRKRKEQQAQLNQARGEAPFAPFQGLLDSDLDGVSNALLTQLTGRPILYEETGYVSEHRSGRQGPQLCTDRDVETYEQLTDLYWWYCKMDNYQGILSGTKLFMEYDTWTQVCPRGPIGRIDCIFGTFDHLMLVLGRLTDFASRDIVRKRKARKAGPPPPPGHSPPPFPGLLPTKGQYDLPTGMSPPRDKPADGEDPVEENMEAWTAAAIEEWQAIRQAFEVFRAQLGADFEPLGPEHAPVQPSPFGPALTYRTYSIAGIWLNYYMGLVHLYRAHPSMPPYGTVAAGMSAAQTGRWANEIGRISAGLAEDCTNLVAVSTLVGAAFIESSFCLFVAAVQYQDPIQRDWTIRRLHDVGRLTGWQSAIAIANGCETMWMKAADMGRGPLYARLENIPRPKGTLGSIWDNPRRIDHRIQDDVLSDEGKVVLAKSEQAHYAIGLIGFEQDLERLDLAEKG